MSRSLRATPVVRQDGEVERALRAPLLLGERLERLHVVVEAELLAQRGATPSAAGARRSRGG